MTETRSRPASGEDDRAAGQDTSKDQGSAPAVSHVFIADTGGLCFCGRPRMVGVHVAEADEAAQLRAMVLSCLGAIHGELVALQTLLARLGVLDADS